MATAAARLLASELGEDVGHVADDGVLAEHEALGDLAVGQALRHQASTSASRAVRPPGPRPGCAGWGRAGPGPAAAPRSAGTRPRIPCSRKRAWAERRSAAAGSAPPVDAAAIAAAATRCARAFERHVRPPRRPSGLLQRCGRTRRIARQVEQRLAAADVGMAGKQPGGPAHDLGGRPALAGGHQHGDLGRDRVGLRLAAGDELDEAVHRRTQQRPAPPARRRRGDGRPPRPSRVSSPKRALRRVRPLPSNAAYACSASSSSPSPTSSHARSSPRPHRVHSAGSSGSSSDSHSSIRRRARAQSPAWTATYARHST